MTGNDLVDAIGEMAFEGHITPWSWYQTLRFANGKVDLIAITLLGDIVFWYRPVHEFDEATGNLIGTRKRFKADLLQRSYQSWAEQFGLTKRQAKDACFRLENDYGVIRRVFRTIDTPTGRLANVLFIAPVPEKIRAITHQRQTSDVRTSDLSRLNVTPLTLERQTNTEITTEITTGGEGERARATTNDGIPAGSGNQTTPLTPPTRSYRMPAEYTPSAAQRATLEADYPALDFEEEMRGIHDWEYDKPKSDWDAATRTWFRRAETRRRERAAAPGKGDSGRSPEEAAAAYASLLAKANATTGKDAP
jgi:hypothetical protein